MDVKKVKVEDLNLPVAPAQAPQIDWGQEFLEWDPEQQNRYLRRLCSALNHATDNIQQERDRAVAAAHEIKAVAEQADKAVEIQKAIVNRSLTAFNAEKQDLIRRIQELETENKDLTIQNKSFSTRLKRYEDK